MIIFISNEENQNLLNTLAAQHEWELLVEVMEHKSLQDYITDKLQVIANLQYIVIDKSCITENEHQLNDLIESMRVMWDTKAILLEEELINDRGERQKVIYDKHTTFLYKYQDNLAKNLEYLLNGDKIPAEEIYEGIWVGVMSSNSGAGVTHLAISLANYIKNNNERVCYVEANESGALGAMAEFYEMELVEENHYQRDGVDYWHQSIDPEKKFAVLDLGKFTSAKLTLFNQCKIKILVTDGKPYRMSDALNVLQYINDENARLWVNFSREKDYEEVSTKYLQGVNNPIGRIIWHDDMFQGEDALYKDVLDGYIYVPQKKSRFAAVLNKDRIKDIIKSKKREVATKAQEEIADIQENDSLDLSEDNIVENILPVDDALEEEMLPANDIVAEENEAVEMVDIEDVNNAEPSVSEINNNETIVKEPMIEEIDNDTDTIEEENIEDTNKTSDIYDEEDSEPEEIVINGIPKKKKPVVSNLLLFLIGGISTLGLIVALNQSAELQQLFSFNKPITEQTTELHDSNLNINPDIKISVLEVEGADGYEVSYSTDREFPEERTIVVEVETADKAVESLTAGKTYYVRVRAFKFNEDGTKVYGEYTEVQEIET